jgi:hypothetical protein
VGKRVGLLAVAGLVVACADPCIALQPVCDSCQHPNHRAACEATVDAEVEEQCELDIENYGHICN